MWMNGEGGERMCGDFRFNMFIGPGESPIPLRAILLRVEIYTVPRRGLVNRNRTSPVHCHFSHGTSIALVKFGCKFIASYRVPRPPVLIEMKRTATILVCTTTTTSP